MYKKFFFKNHLENGLVIIKRLFERSFFLKAAGLTYYSILAFIPILAISFSVAQFFHLKEIVEDQVLEKFADQKIIIEKLIEIANRILLRTRFDLIALISSAVFLLTVWKLIIQMQDAVSETWENQEKISIKKKVADIFGILFIVPVLFIFLGTIQYVFFQKLMVFNQNLEPVFSFLFKGFSFFAFIFFLTFLYIWLPKNKIHFFSAFFSALISGSLFYVFQWLYFYSQTTLTSKNAIYGSFVAIPLFLVWLQLSWILFLMGIEILYWIESGRYYKTNLLFNELNLKNKSAIALWMIQYSMENEGIVSVKLICKNKKFPRFFIRNILLHLVQLDIFQKMNGDFHLNHKIKTIQDLLSVLIENGKEVKQPLEKSFNEVKKMLDEFFEHVDNSSYNFKLERFK